MWQGHWRPCAALMHQSETGGGFCNTGVFWMPWLKVLLLAGSRLVFCSDRHHWQLPPHLVCFSPFPGCHVPHAPHVAPTCCWRDVALRSTSVSPAASSWQCRRPIQTWPTATRCRCPSWWMQTAHEPLVSWGAGLPVLVVSEIITVASHPVGCTSDGRLQSRAGGGLFQYYASDPAPVTAAGTSRYLLSLLHNTQSHINIHEAGIQVSGFFSRSCGCQQMAAHSW